MDRLRIDGGVPLTGEITISGAKNAALPLMAAGLVTDGTLTLQNVPHLVDTASMEVLLRNHGMDVHRDGDTVSIGGTATNFDAPYDLVRKMRASILVLGPLLARYGQARVSLPGAVPSAHVRLIFIFAPCRHSAPLSSLPTAISRRARHPA